MEISVDIADELWQHPQRTWALLRLWALADAEGAVQLSQRDLSQHWGLSRSATADVLRRLASGGWITVERQPGRTTCYRVTGRGMTRRSGPAPVQIAAPTDDVGAEASRLVHRHAERYTNRFGQPFPVAWARDTKLYKNLLKVYGAERVESLQEAYLAQGVDAFAAKRGFSVPQFAVEIAGLAAQVGLKDQFTPEQKSLHVALRQAGLSEDVALALVTEHPADVIQDQLRVHLWRQQQGQPTSAGRLERSIKERWAIPETARPVTYPTFPESRESSDNPADTVPPAVAALIDKIAIKI